ncbi:MAG TPA: hypothetical protein VFS08_10855, partial [Gemmatimonadaceae bacterium]|nr:hypothetical protein [Gemmatimonadaceae bacterium]
PVTYGEIMAALQIASAPADADEPRPGAPGPRGGRLLGAHGATDRERAAISAGRDAQVSEALSDVMAALAKLGQLPGTPSPGRTLDVAGQEDASLVQGVRKLLCTALLKEGDVVAWQTRSRPAQTVSPARDRRAPARRALARAYGAPAPLLFADVTAWRAPEYAAAAVYLDVSGSMAGLVELLHGALLPLRRHLRLSLYAFSNEVVEVSRADFLAGKYRTTWGTDITPVLVHATERAKRVSRVVVLTDGYVGDPTARVLKSFLASKVELHFGVIGDGPLLEGTRWVTSTTRLPTHTRTSSRS